MAKKLATAALIVTAFTSQSAQAETVSTETWNANFLDTITIGGLSSPYSEFGYVLMNITDPSGNLIGVEGTFERLNAGPSPTWITLTGNEYDQLGDFINTGISGKIGLLSIGQYGTIETMFGPQEGIILDTTAGFFALTGTTLIPISDANFSVSRPSAVSAVPAPAAVWLFASGIGVFGLSRKKMLA